jgi:hypothetical protein
LECILNLVDPVFDQGHTENYRLSILLKPDGFSFSVLDPRNITFVALFDYLANPSSVPSMKGIEKFCNVLREYLHSNELLNKEYGSLDLVYASPKVTLVPQGFLSQGNTETYFKFNHNLEAVEVIKDEIVPVGEMSAVFAIPTCLARLQEDLFPGIKIGCATTVLIQGLLKANAHILVRQVFVNVWGAYFDVLVIQGSRLLYYNTFRKQMPEDIVYFVLFVLEQLGFIPTEEEVTLIGDITTESDDFKLLFQYIERLNFSNLFPFADLSPVFSGVQVHKYYTLFNLPFCG